MASINNMLYSIQNMAPALLSIGVGGRGANYDGLGALTNSLFGTGSNSSVDNYLDSFLNGGSTSSSGEDKVSLTYKNIGDKIVSDMATLTADTIKEYPELDKDYVIAIIDDGVTREARVYSRAEILANFEGTDEERKSLEKELAANPLMVFNNDNGLPESSDRKGAQALAKNLNDFLSKNNKSLNTVSKAGYDPFADMLGDSTMKKILASYAGPQEIDEDDAKMSSQEKAAKLMEDLKVLIDKAVSEESSLKDDYVVAIIDNAEGREAKVYSRSAILENFEGTEEEKAALEKQLKANPLMVFLKGGGLENSAEDGAYGELASALNKFLTDNSDTLDKLDKDGCNPLADIIGDSNVKKALANYLAAIEEEEEEGNGEAAEGENGATEGAEEA